MKITFTDQNSGTSVSLSDDNLTTDGEITLDCFASGVEAWHSFKTLKELEDFSDSVDEMKNRFKKHLGV